MPVDPSVYNQMQQPNLLQQYGAVMSIRNAQQQNQLLQTENQRAQVALNTDQVNNAWLHLTKAGEAAGTLLNDPGQLNMKKFDTGATGVLTDGDYPTDLKAGLVKDIVGIKANIAQQIAAQNPQGDPALTDKIIRQSLQGILTTTENGRAQLQAIYGSPQAVNVGPVTKLQRVGINGQVHDLGSLQNGLSPGEAATQVPTINDRTPGTTTLGAVAGPTGGLSTQAPGTFIPPNGGGAPSPSAPSAAPAPVAAQGGAPAAPFNPTGLPAGEGSAIEHAGTASADQYSALRQQVGGSASRIFQLRQAMNGLENAGSTGPGTDAVNNAKSFLLAQSPDWLKKFLPGINPEQIKSYDEANKYLTQYASGVAGSFGAHTDHQLATTLAGNASTHISNLAAKDVVKANIALERMGQAQALAFQQTGQTPDKFADWAVNWNTTHDPRAFLADQLTMAERKKLQASLKPGSADYARFVNTYRQARDLGIISPNDIPQ